jgi:hypothetical protein
MDARGLLDRVVEEAKEHGTVQWGDFALCAVAALVEIKEELQKLREESLEPPAAKGGK